MPRKNPATITAAEAAAGDPTEIEALHILEEMQLAQPAPAHPAAPRVGEVLQTVGDLPVQTEDGQEISERVAAPMQISSIAGDGTEVQIYDTKTGEASRALYYMLPDLMKLKRPDGTRIWTTRDPRIPDKTQRLKCRLHPDDPNRALYDSWGLPVCPKENLPNLYHRSLHEQHRHPSAYKQIEMYEEQQRKAEERAWQRQLFEMAHGQKSA